MRRSGGCHGGDDIGGGSNGSGRWLKMTLFDMFRVCSDFGLSFSLFCFVLF